MDALAARVGQALKAAGVKLATAESCTGGLVVHALTEVPGSSAYVRGGIVAYANDVKAEQLGVPHVALDAHGAVSAQVAVAMAEGARDRLHADLGVGVTGVAGPGGGTDEKPVGLVYVAVAGLGTPEVRRFLWTGDRIANKRDSAVAAIELLIARVEAAPGRGVT
jgi:nicotinamide-nucleotide amidase